MRPLRIDWPDARHHVYNRTRRCERIFEHDDACELFLQLLAQLPEKFGVRVHGYAIMPDHYHLLLQSDGNLSVAMQWFKSMFVRKLNARRQGWDGSLFRGRFQSKPVDTDAYWRKVLAYVHLNPVADGLAPSPDAARWTSFDAYVGDAPDWLTTHELLDLHGGRQGLVDYTEDVQRGTRPKLEAKERFFEARARLQAAEVVRLTALRRRGHSIRSIARRTNRPPSSVYRWLTQEGATTPATLRSTGPTPARSPTLHSP